MKNLRLFIILVILFIVFLPGFAKLQELKAKLAETEEKIRKAQRQNVILEQRIAQLQNNTAYLEMGARDKINAKLGRGTVGLGTTGWRVGGARPGEQKRGEKDAQWRPILKALSPAYTTKWGELLRVR